MYCHGFSHLQFSKDNKKVSEKTWYIYVFTIANKIIVVNAAALKYSTIC